MPRKSESYQKSRASAALRADVAESALCAYLSIVALGSLGVNAIWHLTWADPIAALVSVPLILREGWEAMRARLVVVADSADYAISYERRIAGPSSYNAKVGCQCRVRPLPAGADLLPLGDWRNLRRFYVCCVQPSVAVRLIRFETDRQSRCFRSCVAIGCAAGCGMCVAWWSNDIRRARLL